MSRLAYRSNRLCGAVGAISSYRAMVPVGGCAPAQKEGSWPSWCAWAPVVRTVPRLALSWNTSSKRRDIVEVIDAAALTAAMRWTTFSPSLAMPRDSKTSRKVRSERYRTPLVVRR